jgi:hypothetical protein
LALLRIGVVLESTHPLENPDRADRGKPGFKLDIEVISPEVAEVAVHSVLTGRGLNEGEAFRHRFQCNDGPASGEWAGGLTPTRAKIQDGSITRREHGIEEFGAARVGDDAMEPGFGHGKTVVYDLSPGPAGFNLRNESEKVCGRGVSKPGVTVCGI